jgi:PAS domain S-box-containing protein
MTLIDDGDFSDPGAPVVRAGDATTADREFRRLLERLPIAAYTCDPDGLITYFNAAAAALWGRTPVIGDVADRYCGSLRLFACDGTSLQHERCWMAQTLHTGREFNGYEIVIERPDGTRRNVVAHSNPLWDDAGNIRGGVNVLVDVTDRRRSDEAVRQADRAKDEFLATLAHELRNPLAPMRHAVQVLRARQPDGDAKSAMDVIERQMQQMTRLIDDLLDVSRLTRNRLELRKSRVELSDVISLAVETSRPLMESSGHAFSLEVAPDHVLHLDADLTRLAQAISNLLNNAAKYTNRGGHITLKAERQGHEIVLTVRDDGVGIPPDMLGRVFEMFTQARRSTGVVQGGLGIGLTLVKRLVEMHGGTVVARSDGPGRGSEFVIRLPVLLESPPPEEAADSAHLGGRRRLPSGRPLRVQVVDDTHDSANTLGMLLRITGHDVRTAYDGAEALDVARAFNPDVVFLDIGMPRISGYDAARAMRAEPWGHAVILIALTGWGQPEDRARSMAAGFDHHLVKPVEPRVLLKILADLREAAEALTES